MDAAYLSTQISAVMTSWVQEMIRNGCDLKGGVNSNYSVPVGSVPLICNEEHAGVKFGDLVANLYETDVNETTALFAWDAACEHMIEVKPNLQWAVRSEFRRVYPDVDFTLQGNPYNACAQYLKLLSFSAGYTLTITFNKCLLKTPSNRVIGIDRSALYTSTKAVRTKRKLHDLREPLRIWRGRLSVRPHHRFTRRAYLLMHSELPRYAKQIDAIFAIGMEAGEQVEPTLYSQLDIWQGDEYANEIKAIHYQGDFATAHHLIKTSQDSPITTLAKVLAPYTTVKRFRELFGDPYLVKVGTYSEGMRRNDLMALDKVVLDQDAKGVDEAEVKEKSELDNLLSTMFGV